ncbi:MAG: DUF3343 domain-containing protein [Thermodesulforhabdaceae bacterium]
MGILSVFKRKKNLLKPEQSSASEGMLVFENTSEVIKAERVLKDAGYNVRVMGPPPELRTGCDLVVVFPIVIQLQVIRLLKAEGLEPVKTVPVSSPLLSPVSLFHVKEFGDFIMVRAANMKLSFEKGSGLIVNISGGGCPDVPFVAAQMIGKTLWDAPSPREIGYTLCAYALSLALEHGKSLCPRPQA